jgi:hypothetical protein
LNCENKRKIATHSNFKKKFSFIELNLISKSKKLLSLAVKMNEKTSNNITFIFHSSHDFPSTAAAFPSYFFISFSVLFFPYLRVRRTLILIYPASVD